MTHDLRHQYNLSIWYIDREKRLRTEPHTHALTRIRTCVQTNFNLRTRTHLIGLLCWCMRANQSTGIYKYIICPLFIITQYFFSIVEPFRLLPLFLSLASWEIRTTFRISSATKTLFRVLIVQVSDLLNIVCMMYSTEYRVLTEMELIKMIE